MNNNERAVRMFLKHQYMIRDFILGLVRQPADADDIFQEVSLVVLQKEDVPLDEKTFPGWCRQVAKNRVLHYWRDKRNKGRQLSADVLAAVERAYECGDDMYNQYTERSAALRRCMKRLNERNRRILTSYYQEGRTSEEIAENASMAAPSVRRLLMQMRQSLRNCVEKRLVGGTA